MLQPSRSAALGRAKLFAHRLYFLEARRNPKMRAAPGFHKRMMPSPSQTTTA
jgi:hypothetical protein